MSNTTDLVEYHEAVQRGDNDTIKLVRDRIIRQNLNLVRALAHKYARATTHLELDDLVNEGVIGMMEAIKRFDPNRGLEFSTYATYWIRRDILRSLSSLSRTIRVPERVACALPKIRRATADFVSTFGYEPDSVTIAVSLGISPAVAKDACSLLQEPAALVNDEGEPIDVESDADPVDEQVSLKLRNERLRAVIDSVLTDKQAQVILGRYGLGDDCKVHTLEDLGDRLGVSREWVRQLEIAAISKLREELCSADF